MKGAVKKKKRADSVKVPGARATCCISECQHFGRIKKRCCSSDSKQVEGTIPSSQRAGGFSQESPGPARGLWWDGCVHKYTTSILRRLLSLKALVEYGRPRGIWIRNILPLSSDPNWEPSLILLPDLRSYAYSAQHRTWNLQSKNSINVNSEENFLP